MAKMVEVDEGVFAASQRAIKTVQDMLANPASRRKVLEAQKIIAPDTVIPELDAQKPVDDALAATNQKLDALTKKLDDDKADRDQREKLADLNSRFDKGRAKLRAAGFTDEGLKAIEALMDEKGIVDHEIAAAYYEKHNPPPPPASPSGYGAWDLVSPAEGDDFTKKLLESRGDDEGAVRQMANQTLADLRGSRR